MSKFREASETDRQPGWPKQRVYVFADEAGNMDFRSLSRGASRYFILTTITLLDCSIGDRLLNLRRQLAWEQMELKSELHAAEERQAVRDRVFALLAEHEFRVDSSIFNKASVAQHLRDDPDRFYKLVWWYHLKYVAPKVVRTADELLVVGAAMGTRKKRTLLHASINEVVRQVTPSIETRTAYWSAASDPCLQIADYCCWAIQRKWEQNDDRSYVLIRNKIRSEFLFFGPDNTTPMGNG